MFKEIESKLEAFENKCLKNILSMQCIEFKIKADIREMSNAAKSLSSDQEKKVGIYGARDETVGEPLSK